MELLPRELLEHIFKQLTEDRDLLSVEAACKAFSGVVVTTFWHRRLAQLFQSDVDAERRLRGAGWSPEDPHEDPSLTRRLFLRLKHVRERHWTGPRATRTDCIMKQCPPERFVEEMPADFVIYRDKAYVGLKNTAIEVWHLSPPAFCHALHAPPKAAGPEANQGHILRHCSIALHGSLLVAIDETSSKVMGWDLDTEDHVLDLASPKGKMYDVGVCSRAIIALSGWSMHLWMRSGPKGLECKDTPVFYQDFSTHLDFSDWMSCHRFCMNESFVVSLGTWRDEERENSAPRSKMHVRKLTKDKTTNMCVVSLPGLQSVFDESLEITELCLSEGSLLAVLITETRKDPAGMCYCIHIADLSTDSVLHVLARSQSLLSDIQIPVCWQGPRLLYKMVPMPGKDEHVTLGLWNSREASGVKFIPSVQMLTPNDLLRMTTFGVVRVHNAFPSVQPTLEEAATMELTANISVYDFWSCDERCKKSLKKVASEGEEKAVTG